MDTPELTDDLIDTIADQSDAQAGDRSIRDLAQERDRNLVAILSALESVGAGAGQTLAQLRELQQPS
jgi:carnitine 3-dehydrogenase